MNTVVVVTLLMMSSLSYGVAEVFLDFRVTPSILIPSSTTNMTLSCKANQFLRTDRQNLSTLKILKNSQEGWRILAQLTDLEPSSVQLLDQSPIASSGNLSRSNSILGQITVTWDRPSTDGYGQYMCLATKFDTQENHIITNTASLSIGKDLKPLDLLLLMKDDRTVARETISNLRDRLEQALQACQSTDGVALTELGGEINRLWYVLNDTLDSQALRFEALKQELEDFLRAQQQPQTEKINEMEGRLDVLLRRGFLNIWPQGTYGLPLPETGCPSSAGVVWDTGYRLHQTETSDINKDDISPGNHLKHPVKAEDDDGNSVYQRFCVKTEATNLGPTWPKGSYCIHKVNDCPVGFSEGSITWDDAESDSGDVSGGRLPAFSISSDETKFDYCCREDGSSEMPVHLPVSRPFYLYRRGGKCQKVAGMDVTEESITFDTKNTNNQDSADGKHPDVELDNIVLHLCYYGPEL